MKGFRSPKVLLIILAVLLVALYSINVGNSNTTNVVIKSFDLSFLPDRIKASVELQNHSNKTRNFSDFTLHCTNTSGNDVTFKVLNNLGDPSIPAADTGPQRLKADNNRSLDLIGEKNEFYHSPADCQQMAVGWKVDGKSYYGQPISSGP